MVERISNFNLLEGLFMIQAEKYTHGCHYFDKRNRASYQSVTHLYNGEYPLH
jgi:hypothetical protein